MDVLLVAFFALIGSCLTFFCGFGLGTVLLSVFILFFKLDVAIVATAIVHISTNLFKVSILRKGISKKHLIEFGIPAIIFSFVGAFCLGKVNYFDKILGSYELFGRLFDIHLIKLIVGIVILLFAFGELFGLLNRLTNGSNKLIAGGILSGFFGGFTGHQGALRSAFLTKTTNDKALFLATSACIGLAIDAVRIPTYFVTESKNFVFTNQQSLLIVTGIGMAVLGAFLGNKYLKKKNFEFVNYAVGIGLMIIGALLIAGLI